MIIEISKDIKLAQLFVDYVTKWYNSQSLGSRIVYTLQIIPYHKEEHFCRLTFAEVWDDLLLNIMFVNNGGKRCYCELLVINQEEDNEYHFALQNFRASLEIHTPFRISQDDYRSTYTDLRQAVDDKYKQSFVIPKSVIKDQLLKYKLKTT